MLRLGIRTTGGRESLRTYRGKRSWGRIFGYLLATLMVFSGLALVGYSFLMGDPLASAAIFGKEPPKSGDLSLTVPDMRRVEDVPVFTGPANDEDALHDGTLHVDSTGFPWQEGSNTYIAGHRMGFPGTASYLVFWDLDNLEAGDEVVLTDADGTRYNYEVFEKFIVNPDAYSVTQPVPGRSVVSLQTCTLPDYSQRLVVQAELTSVV
jgi:sortase A